MRPARLLVLSLSWLLVVGCPEERAPALGPLPRVKQPTDEKACACCGHLSGEAPAEGESGSVGYFECVQAGGDCAAGCSRPAEAAPPEGELR